MVFGSWPTLDQEMDKLPILDVERGIGSPNGLFRRISRAIGIQQTPWVLGSQSGSEGRVGGLFLEGLCFLYKKEKKKRREEKRRRKGMTHGGRNGASSAYASQLLSVILYGT